MSVPSYRRSPDVLWRSVGTDVILTRPKTETMAELSESGAEIWRLLAETRSARRIAARLGGSSIDTREIEVGVKALLEDLVWRGYCTHDDR